MVPERWPLVTAAEMRALDRATIEGLDVPGELLMEVAGHAVARQAQAALAPAGRVWVVAGAGNNGGDGWVAARHLHLRGVPVQLISTQEPAALSGDAAANARRAETAGVPRAERLDPRPGDVVVDALFGTGLSRPVEGVAAEWIARVNARPQGVAVLAVDLPSGLQADTGQVLGSAVRADATLTLGLPKRGLALEPGREHAGAISVARIGIVDTAPGTEPQAELWTRAGAGRRLPARPAAGHKGSFGHVLVVAGSVGMSGAAALAARAAGRSGAGLVSVACPASTNGPLEALLPEAMTHPVAEHAEHGFALEAVKAVLELAGTRAAVVLGPGVGRHPETARFVQEVAPAVPVPLVLDADGLHALREDPGVLKGRRAPTIVTPHPGEAAILLGSNPVEVQADRPAAALALAAETGAVVVLKGAGTVTAEPSGRMVINPTGGPVLGTGGTGDVLAGVIGALQAQGVAPFEAGALGAFVHGAAGDLLATTRGAAGALAGEVAERLPDVLAALRSAAQEPTEWRGDVLAFPEP